MQIESLKTKEIFICIIYVLFIDEELDHLEVKKNKKIIFWMYTRYVYSAIERNLDAGNLKQIISDIKNDSLYKQFLAVNFEGINKKAKVMIYCLKYANNNILLLLIKFISLVKKSFPIIFAKFKG